MQFSLRFYKVLDKYSEIRINCGGPFNPLEEIEPVLPEDVLREGESGHGIPGPKSTFLGLPKALGGHFWFYCKAIQLHFWFFLEMTF